MNAMDQKARQTLTHATRSRMNDLTAKGLVDAAKRSISRDSGDFMFQGVDFQCRFASARQILQINLQVCLLGSTCCVWRS